MTYETSDPNPTCSEDSTLEESMWYILSFEIVKKTKGLFLVWPLGGLFITFQPSLLEFRFSLLVLNFCSTELVVVTLIQFRLTLSILENLSKNKPQNIRMIYETKKRWVQDPYGGFFNFCKINIYGLECYRCVCHDLLSRIYVTLLPSSKKFTGIIIMVHHPYTYYVLNIIIYLG